MRSIKKCRLGINSSSVKKEQYVKAISFGPPRNIRVVIDSNLGSEYMDMFENEAKINVIDVNLEPFLDETFESPDVSTVESILLEALGLFEEENG